MSKERLRRIIESNSEQRERDEARDAARREREKEIADAPGAVRWPFWCDSCGLDFESVGFKTVIGAYELPIALYETKCPDCRGFCRRRITERNGDDFFWKSKALNRQRRMMAKDLLQPGDPGFDEAYPQHRRRLEAEAEANERLEHGRRRSQDNR